MGYGPDFLNFTCPTGMSIYIQNALYIAENDEDQSVCVANHYSSGQVETSCTIGRLSERLRALCICKDNCYLHPVSRTMF